MRGTAAPIARLSILVQKPVEFCLAVGILSMIVVYSAIPRRARSCGVKMERIAGSRIGESLSVALNISGIPWNLIIASI